MNKRRIQNALKRLSHLPGGIYLFLYIGNKLYDMFLRLMGSTKVAYPSTIMLELTNHCNLHCTTCPREYDYGKEMDKGYIELVQAKKIIDEVWPYLDSIGLTGMGETFLSQDIPEIIDYIKSKNSGIIISASTNAVLPHFLEYAAKIVGKIDTVQISIDGLDDVYERIRKNAHFGMFHENIKQLASLCEGTRTTLMLNMVVTKENYHQMHKMIAYADEMGVQYVNFAMFNLVSVSTLNAEYYQFYASEEFLQELERVDDNKKKHPTVEVSNWDFTSKNEFQKCRFPWTHFYICWNGFVAPCCAKPFPKEMNFGNAFNCGLMKVLNSLSYRNFRAGWFKNQAPPFCNNCLYLELKPIEVR